MSDDVVHSFINSLSPNLITAAAADVCDFGVNFVIVRLPII